MKSSASWIASTVRGTLLGEDVAITAQVQTDSRQIEPGSLYVARVGQETDGHEFVAAAVASGAVCVIVERAVPVSIPQIVVENSTVALGQLAKAYLRELRATGGITVIGITGSAGKTTTKDLLGQILSAAGPTVFPVLSFNNEVGCPLTILRANQETRFLILEMGASGPGHLAYLTEIAPLDIATVLMVGTAHLGGFGTVQILVKSKQELVQGLLPNGIAILNADDPQVAAMSSAAPNGVRYFSQRSESGAALWAEEIKLCASGKAGFWLCSDTERVRVDLNLVGAHQVSNALAAASVAKAVGIDLGQIAAVMSASTPLSPHRMAVYPGLQIGSSTSILLIDDSYNANPDSMQAGLTAARQLSGNGRIIAVLGEMLELGEESDELHERVGAMAFGVNADHVVGVGRGAAALTRSLEGLTEITLCSDYRAAVAILPTIVRTGDTLFLKGSSGSQVWRVADCILDGTMEIPGERQTEVIR